MRMTVKSLAVICVCLFAGSSVADQNYEVFSYGKIAVPWPDSEATRNGDIMLIMSGYETEGIFGIAFTVLPAHRIGYPESSMGLDFDPRDSPLELSSWSKEFLAGVNDTKAGRNEMVSFKLTRAGAGDYSCYYAEVFHSNDGRTQTSYNYAFFLKGEILSVTVARIGHGTAEGEEQAREILESFVFNEATLNRAGGGPRAYRAAAEINSPSKASSPGDAPDVSEGAEVHRLEVESRGLDSDIIVNPGDRLEFKASGSIRVGAFAGTSGPSGINGYTAYNRVQGFKHGALLFRIGGSEWVGVGLHLEYEVRSEGRIVFAVNDADPGNNRGQYLMDLTVIRAQ
ncbi:MAG: hypothetical protein GY838_16045 [bacterium]|nr:hypothetical protein [bacterium]